ncbi:hypothetical protein HK100_006077 [Physocladia obscura]|uniref:Uncharacterized protein n=1 Tax=Physocladia obscura TaxID=109957 RepID=A0AAD5T614_9FUNG|nr:hypothetical protein HK100_006077 [Physocladia obscura]
MDPFFDSTNFTGNGTFLDTQSAKTGVGLCLAAYIVYGCVALGIAIFRPHANKSTDFFITARNSQSTLWSACSWFASAMGAWTLYGPASLVADPYYGTGIIGLAVYAIFTGLPLVMLAYGGSSVRDNVPQATSVSSYARWRFGIVAQVFVLFVVLLSLILGLVAEYQAIGGIFQTFFGVSPYVPLLTGGIITMIYTSVGGLYVSIITDFFQTIVVWILTAFFVIYMAVSFKGEPLGPLPEYLGVTDLGWETLATLMLPFICSTFYGEAFWQRVWSAENNNSLRRGAIIGGGMATIVIFILGFGGILAFWSGRANINSENPNNSSYAFFYAFADSKTGMISSAVVVVIILFASIMNESAIDSMQNAISDTVTSTFIGLFGIHIQPIYVRVVVLVANIPIMAGAAYLTTSNVSILNAYGITNMSTTMTFAPLAAGLIPQLNKYLTTFSAIGACFGSFIATTIYAYNAYGNLYDGMTALWWTSAYDYRGFITAFFSSIACIPLFIGIELLVRYFLGKPIQEFVPVPQAATEVKSLQALDAKVSDLLKA